jgi:outer membrane lipoprotein carrier protein
MHFHSALLFSLFLLSWSWSGARTSAQTPAPSPAASSASQTAASAPTPTQDKAVADPARVALSTVQAFYDQTRDVAADFHQTYVNKLYDRTDRSQGHVIFKKPGKMRWDYQKPNGKVVVAGAGKLTVYDPPEEEGEKGQVLEQAFAQAELPQALSFLLGTGRLADDFDARLLDAAKEGFANGQVLELKAKVPSPHFERLLFYVETSAALRGLVRRLVIVDANGNRNRFDFSGFKFNAGTPEANFEWHAPADARRVHL